jgi:hypothetical protein
MCSRRVSRSCSTRETRNVTLVTKPVMRQDWCTDLIVIMTNGTYLWNISIPNLTNDLLLEDILDKDECD